MSRLFPYLVVALLLAGPGAAQTTYKHVTPPPQDAMAAGTADPSFHRAMAEAMDRMTKDMTIPRSCEWRCIRPILLSTGRFRTLLPDDALSFTSIWDQNALTFTAIR